MQQGKKAFYALLTKIKKLQLPVDISLELFNQLVVPVLTYGCEVWGFCNFNSIEILQRKFIKIILGVNKCTPNVMIYGETGLYPIEHVVNMRMINFYMRIINGKQSKFSYVLYQVLRKRSDIYNMDYRWIDHVKQELNNMGMPNLWNLHGDGFSNIYVKEAIRIRYKDIHLQKWLALKESHSYCNFYDVIKTDFTQEKYLVELNYHQRVAMSKFRCRSNYLPISSSRFVNLDDSLGSVICPLCNNQDMGDEFHYLFICPFFEDERKQCLNIVPTYPDLFYTHNLFNSRDISQLSKLANFVDLIMKIFQHRNEWENGL